MAFVTAGRTATFSMKDTGGKKTTRTFDLVATTDAQAQTDVGVIFTKLQLVTKCSIDSYTISEKFVDDAFALPVGAEVHDQLLITMPIASKPNKSGTVIIPSPEDTLLVAPSGEGNEQPDFTEALLISYLDIFTSVGNQAYISDGEVATKTNARGKRIHAKSNGS
jgi:hypothetical protein